MTDCYTDPHSLSPTSTTDCPQRVSKAETILRNRTSRIALVLCDLEFDSDIQPILRSADALSIQEVYNLSNFHNTCILNNPGKLQSKLLCKTITKSTHSFLSFINIGDINELLSKYCISDDIDSPEVWYITNNAEPQYYSFDNTTPISPTTNSTEYQTFINNNKLYNNDDYIYINSTPSNNQDNIHSEVIMARVPTPLSFAYFTPNIVNHNKTDAIIQHTGLCTRYKQEYAKFLYNRDYCNQTITSGENIAKNTQNIPQNSSQYQKYDNLQDFPSFDEWYIINTQQIPSSQQPTMTPKTPCLFPSKVFLLFDQTFSNTTLQLMAHRHVYIPSLHHTTSNNCLIPSYPTPSLHCAIYIDRLLALCPEAIGDLPEAIRNEIRPKWLKALSTSEKRYLEFLHWHNAELAQPGTIPLLETLRMSLIEKYWAKDGRKLALRFRDGEELSQDR